VETTDIDYDPGTGTLGRIVALGAPSPEFRHPKHVRPGLDLTCSLVVSEDYAAAAVNLERSLAYLAFHAHVYAFKGRTGNTIGAPLTPSYAVDVPGRCVTVTIPAPTSPGKEYSIIIAGVSVASVPLSCGAPVVIPLVKCIVAPLTVPAGAAYSTLAVSATGTLYAPAIYHEMVPIFDFNGKPQGELSVSDFGLTNSVRAAAFDDATDTLFLADYEGQSKRVAAIDATKRKLRWAISDVDNNILGMAALSQAGIIILAVSSGNNVQARRMSDGTRLGDIHVSYPIHVAADPVTGEILVSTPDTVKSLRWTGSSFVDKGIVSGISKATNQLLLTVVPPAPGGRCSHLVVASFGATHVDIVSLPSHDVVAKAFKLPDGMTVVGFAADRSGTIIGICSHSATTHILPWPLAWLPPLP
jgi:hypothetical protein